MINQKNKSIILFDGVCNLCNRSVQFIIKRDYKKQYLYASLQSDAANDLLLQYNLRNSGADSIILIEEGKIFTESTAILKVLKHLGFGWKLAYGFIIVPKFLRDGLYKLIARNRYTWFGKKDVCMVPTEEVKIRFLD